MRIPRGPRLALPGAPLALLIACGSPSGVSRPPDAPALAEATADGTAASPTAPSGGWRLAATDSPYLRAHAQDPVDWHPWGAEAFAEARARDVPVLVSIGYSTCHWCHVMQHESFADPDVAAFLRGRFVCVKVDREQHPAVDARFMDAIVALTGSGGWPLTVFCTPTGAPFLGGTYFPARAGFGLPAFRDVLERVLVLWTDQRALVDAAARDLDAALALDRLPAASDAPDLRATFDGAAHALAASLDPVVGGVRAERQKFPPTLTLALLLRARARGLDVDLAPLATTLDVMAVRGLRDALGGGFFRYCTDPQWLVPHFEKMLTDNAQLAQLYAEAAVATGQPRQADVARDTLAFVRRELRLPDGLYATALDADSLPYDDAGRPRPDARAEEGAFFLWTRAQLVSALGPDDGPRAAALLGLTDDDGPALPRPMRTPDALADDPGVAGVPRGAAFRPWWDDVRARLLATRDRRPRPARDDKALASANGLLLSAFARAGRLLGDDELVDESDALARALLAALVDADGRVAHQVFERRASGAGTLADHACVARGLLDAYEAGGDTALLVGALRVTRSALVRFVDTDGGGFFETGDDDPVLAGRARRVEDGVVPAGQSVLLEVLLRLAPLDDSGAFADAADLALRRLAPWLAAFPAAFPAALAAADAALGPLAEVVLDGAASDDEGHAALLAAARAAWLPCALIVPSARDAADALAAAGAFDEEPTLLAGRRATRGGVAWLCTRGACLLPIDDPRDLAPAWERLRRR